MTTINILASLKRRAKSHSGAAYRYPTPLATGQMFQVAAESGFTVTINEEGQQSSAGASSAYSQQFDRLNGYVVVAPVFKLDNGTTTNHWNGD